MGIVDSCQSYNEGVLWSRPPLPPPGFWPYPAWIEPGGSEAGM
jgi:hypothetical protein